MAPRNKKTRMHRCAMCDEYYDDTNIESVRRHEHPEPQSGYPRDHLMKSRLPYEQWIIETAEGREWQALKGRNMHGTA